MRSFLLDAGAEYNGYAADLTRTWAAHGDNDFAHLIKDVNDEQLALISTMKAGPAMWITISSSISASQTAA
jgi:Xaa-Pro dipeptidase